MSGKRYSVDSKLELIKLVEDTGNVAEACKRLGYSRDSYYRIFSKYQAGGAAALEPQSGPRPLIKNRVDSTIEAAILDLARHHPTWGQARIAHELKQSGLTVSAGGVRCVWQRNNLETVEKRLQALVSGTMPQQDANAISYMWSVQSSMLNNQSIDAPGKSCLQDCIPAFTLDYGVRVFQHTFIDAFSRFVFARLYLSNQHDAALDLLNNHVIPDFAQHSIQINQIATPRSTAFGGQGSIHAFEAYLALQDITHVFVNARGSQEMTIVKSFYRFLREQSFPSQRTSATKLSDLQNELDQLLNKYNYQHAVTRYGRYSLSPANMLKAVSTNTPSTQSTADNITQTAPSSESDWQTAQVLRAA